MKKQRKQFSFMELRNQGQNGTRGYAMAALLVAIGVLAVLMTVALPTWRQMVQREKEEELIFRGRQYVRAISLFQRKYAASYPPSVDILLSQHYLRKKYKDPMTADGEFQILYQMSAQQTPGTGRGGTQNQGQPGAGGRGGSGFGSQGGGSFGGGTLGPQGGMVGVASKSTDTSIRLYNGRNHYNEWQFIFVPTVMPGQGRPGMPGAGGRGGMSPGGVGPGGGRGMGPGGGRGMGGRGMGPGGGTGPGGQFPQGGRGGRGQ
jgi:type II secretory pathway pseudopilin PulG